MRTSMRIEGFEEVDGNLEKLQGMTDAEQLRALGFEALDPVAVSARGLVRTGTGRLRRSIATGDKLSPAQAAQSNQEPGTVEVYVGPGPLVQAVTEEFGTVHEQGHPFMRPAWDGNVDEVVARLRKGAGALLRRLAGG